MDGSTKEGLVGEGRRHSIWSVLSLEASRTPREMGRRQLDEGIGSSRENLDTDAGGGCRERRYPPIWCLKAQKGDRGGTVREEGREVGQEERVNSRRLHRGVLQEKG